MCTYNGEAYLLDQLNSISFQSELPEMVVVVDDCSTDNTWNILDAWKSRCNFQVLIIRNQETLGVVKNFEKALKLVQTDIIFLCDQDDLWHPDKIKTLANAISESNDILLVHTNAELVDQTARSMGITLFDALGVTHRERASVQGGHAFKVLLRRNIVTGATVAIRRELLNCALPFPKEYLHDEWIGLIASVKGRLRIVDACTISYRQHGKNIVGAKRLSRPKKLKNFWWRINAPHSKNEIQNRVESSRVLCDRLKTLTNISQEANVLAENAFNFNTRRSVPSASISEKWGKIFFHVIRAQFWKFSETPITDLIRDITYK